MTSNVIDALTLVYSPSIRGNNDVSGILFVEKCVKVHKNQLHLYHTDESRLQMVMNAAAGVVTGCDNYEHITPLLRDVLHWLPVPQRIQIYLFITFRVSRRPREMYCGHARLCVCVCMSVCPRPHAHTIARTQM